MAHAGLGGEVDDDLGLPGDDARLQGVVIGDVELLEGKAVARGQAVEPSLLQRRIVIGSQVVDAENLHAPRQQRLCDMKADEARSARQQHFSWQGGGDQTVGLC